MAKTTVTSKTAFTSKMAAALLLTVAVSFLPPVFSKPQPRVSLPGDDAEAQYLSAIPNDPVARLQKRLDEGSAHLEYYGRHGYLRAVLREMNIAPSTQTLVFSKTSFQFDHIGPQTPRALYFNDDVYVGWVQEGRVLEIASVDPVQGPVFYTLQQQKDEHPRFVRATIDCLGCHGVGQARTTPNLVVRSVYALASGVPDLSAGSSLTTPRSALESRWGGWYVTGQHGAQRHMGNQVARGGFGEVTIDRDAGANVTNLRSRFPVARYLTPHSDLVALMLMEHQSDVHNRITQAGYLTRDALRDERRMNAFEELPLDNRRAATVSRIKSACEPLVESLLFSGEATLTAPISGTSRFAHDFAARGPRDRKGRSLRDLDLSRRLMRYPCSYLIYSDAFDALPAAAKSYVFARLRDTLEGHETNHASSHLSREDRVAILEILAGTKPGFSEPDLPRLDSTPSTR